MIRSIFSNFSARLVMQVLYFCTLLITTHILGSEVRGEIGLLQIAITLIQLVSDIVGGPALVYMAPRSQLKTLLFTGWIWVAISCPVTWGILLYFDSIPKGFEIPVLVSAILLSLNSISMNILLGQQRLRQYNLLLYLQGVLMVGGMLSGIYLLGDSNAAPYMDATYIAYGGCATLGIIFVLNHKHVPHITEKNNILMVLFRNGFFTQMANLTFQLSIRYNYYQLDEHIGDKRSSVGIYATAVALAEAILLFAASVASILVAKIANENSSEASRLRAIQLSKLSIGLTIPAVLCFAIMPPEFYQWLLGDSFGPVRDSFRSLVPGVILVSFGTVYGHYFTGTGKPYMNFMSGTFALLLTLFSTQWLVSTYGLTGAGWGASLAYGGLAIFIFTVFMLTSKNLKAEWKELIPRRSDVTALLSVFRQPKDDKPSAE